MIELALIGIQAQTRAKLEAEIRDSYVHHYFVEIAELIDFITSGNNVDLIFVEVKIDDYDLGVIQQHGVLSLKPLIFIFEESTNEGALRSYPGGSLDYISLSEAGFVMNYRIERLLAEVNKQNKIDILQSQLLQSEKMAALGQLAAGVAHEINNPIGFVSSNINLVAKYIDRIENELVDLEKSFESEGSGLALLSYKTWQANSKLGDFLKDLSDVTIESGDGLNRIKEIVKDLKEFTHIGSQEFESTDINSVLRSSVNLLKNEIKYKAEVNFQLGEIDRIDCLSSQINQVFVNIIVNACQAIIEFGEIGIRTEQTSEFVIVTIQDSGTGIEPDKLDSIFEPFYTTKPVGKGTGIGLAITKSIIERHHGEISVKSTMGEGTTFKVSLPLHQIQKPDT